MSRFLAVTSSLLIALVLLAARAGAHDLPNQVVVQAFLEAERDETELVIRVPMVLLQGVDLPTRGPGFVDLGAAEDELRRAAVALADQLRLAVDGQTVVPERYAYRVSLPAERVFETFDSARDHVLGPDLPGSADLMPGEGFLDVYLVYPGVPDGAAPVLDVALGTGYGEFLQLVLRYLPPGGGELAYRVHGDHGPLELDPGFWSAASTFTRSGIEHILSGLDHLLFLLCLVLPFRLNDIRNLVAIVTAFTVAHSITLIATALGAAPAASWFAPAIEAMIAISIVYMALENVVVAWRGGSRLLKLRWLITAVFGLIHGFGFAFVLADELQFAGDHLLVSLLAFNVGVEVGQVGVLLILIPLLEMTRRADPDGRVVQVVVSVMIGHTAWHWMVERLEALSLSGGLEVSSGTVRAVAAAGLILIGLFILASRFRRTRRAPVGGD